MRASQTRAATAFAAALLALSSLGCPAPLRRASPRPQSPRNAPPLAKAVIRTARSYLAEEEKGRPVPKDCSDFVRKVFAENGMDLPRTSVEMAGLGKAVRSSRDLRMADLVIFSGEKVSRKVGHVGIYVGNGVFIHQAKPEIGVVMESLFSDYYRRRYLGARRVID